MNATRRADAFLQVHRGAPLLVHDADLDRVGRQPEGALDAGEDLVGEGDLVGAVHLGLDHIDRAAGRVARTGLLAQVVHRDHHGAHRVEQTLGDLVSVAIEHRRIGHQVTDIAHQHQRAALELQRLAVGRGVVAIGTELAIEARTALGDRLDQVAAHQAQPVAIGQRLVLGVDRGHRILAVHDGGDGGLHQHIGHAGGVCATDLVGRIDLDLDVQAVVAQQHRRRGAGRTAVAGEAGGIRQTGRATGHHRLQGAVGDPVRGDRGMAAGSQGGNRVQELLGPGDHAVAAHRVIAARRGQIAHGIGAIQGVVQAAPAGIGRVQCIAGIHDRHHQLRPRNAGDFGIDVGGLDLEVGTFGDQIADLGQEGAIGGGVVRLAATLAVPGVDGGLQRFATRQQRAVLRPQRVDQVGKAGPELLGAHASLRQRLGFDHPDQRVGNLEAVFLYANRHHGILVEAVSSKRCGRRRRSAARSGDRAQARGEGARIVLVSMR